MRNMVDILQTLFYLNSMFYDQSLQSYAVRRE
jgi:hypothetical protein